MWVLGKDTAYEPGNTEELRQGKRKEGRSSRKKNKDARRERREENKGKLENDNFLPSCNT